MFYLVYRCKSFKNWPQMLNQIQHPSQNTCFNLMYWLKAFKKAALAPSTRHSYNIGIKKFKMFCENFNFMIFPLNEEVFCLFATNLAESVSFKTLKLCLSAVKVQNIEFGFIDFMSKMTQLQLTLRGIKRTLGAHGSRKPSLPILIVTMRLLKQYVFRYDLTNQLQQVNVLVCMHTGLLWFLTEFKLFEGQNPVAPGCAH